MGIIEVLPKILKGLLVALVIFLVACLITTFIYAITGSLKRSVLAKVLMVGHYTAILLGGFQAGRAALSRGWLQGLLVGFVYSTIILIWALLIMNISITLPVMLRYCITIVAGTLGGMLGVNVKA